MATINSSPLCIVEPLRFHQSHGENIRLSEDRTRAIRERLGQNVVFTNRPILPNEIVQFLIEEITNDFFGMIRIGLTVIDPGQFTSKTFPKIIPNNDPQQWFVPTLRGQLNMTKNQVVRLKYTAEGDIWIDFDQSDFVRYLTVSPIAKDVWCAIDVNGMVAQIRILQTESRVLANSIDRARTRYLHYTNNRQHENLAIYYSGLLSNSTVTMTNCDERCELENNIAVKKNSPASVLLDENLTRGMYAVIQILDMDHTLPPYFTIRCLTNGQPSENHSKMIDQTYDHITLGDEIGVRVLRDGSITFSCNNRNSRTLFNIDLTVNDHSQVKQTAYSLEFLLNGRVTAIRLIGFHYPTAEEAKSPEAVGGGCQATVIHKVCPNGLSGLLLPCRHLCVCFECGQTMINRYNCPNIQCRKPVAGCIKVFKG